MNKAGIEEDGFGTADLLLSEPAERLLALQLLRYGEVVGSASTNLEPHRICTFLYELSELFNGFYQQCPVRKAESKALLLSRLRLCDLTRRVLSDGLSLLGIDSPVTM